MMDLTVEDLEQRGRPYIIKLMDEHGVVWRIVRSPVLRGALEEIGTVPEGWAVVVDRVTIEGKGRPASVGDYLSELHRQRENSW